MGQDYAEEPNFPIRKGHVSAYGSRKDTGCGFWLTDPSSPFPDTSMGKDTGRINTEAMATVCGHGTEKPSR